MRYSARGDWVRQALDSMMQSNAAAAAVLSQFRCSACTDVTGFGLIGHLLEMIQFKEQELDENKLTSVDLFLNEVRTLPGAVDCVSMGIMSSLFPENIRCARAIGNVADAQGNHKFPLLFDPQTSGGLLATIPAEHATNCILKLKEVGYHNSAIIGNIVRREKGSFHSLVNLII